MYLNIYLKTSQLTLSVDTQPRAGSRVQSHLAKLVAVTEGTKQEESNRQVFPAGFQSVGRSVSCTPPPPRVFPLFLLFFLASLRYN